MEPDDSDQDGYSPDEDADGSEEEEEENGMDVDDDEDEMDVDQDGEEPEIPVKAWWITIRLGRHKWKMPSRPDDPEAENNPHYRPNPAEPPIRHNNSQGPWYLMNRLNKLVKLVNTMRFWASILATVYFSLAADDCLAAMGFIPRLPPDFDEGDVDPPVAFPLAVPAQGIFPLQGNIPPAIPLNHWFRRCTMEKRTWIDFMRVVSTNPAEFEAAGINSVERTWFTYFSDPMGELQHSKSRILERINEDGEFEEYRHRVGKLDGLWEAEQADAGLQPWFKWSAISRRNRGIAQTLVLVNRYLSLLTYHHRPDGVPGVMPPDEFQREPESDSDDELPGNHGVLPQGVRSWPPAADLINPPPPEEGQGGGGQGWGGGGQTRAIDHMVICCNGRSLQIKVFLHCPEDHEAWGNIPNHLRNRRVPTIDELSGWDAPFHQPARNPGDLFPGTPQYAGQLLPLQRGPGLPQERIQHVQPHELPTEAALQRQLTRINLWAQATGLDVNDPAVQARRDALEQDYHVKLNMVHQRPIYGSDPGQRFMVVQGARPELVALFNPANDENASVIGEENEEELADEDEEEEEPPPQPQPEPEPEPPPDEMEVDQAAQQVAFANMRSMLREQRKENTKSPQTYLRDQKMYLIGSFQYTDRLRRREQCLFGRRGLNMKAYLRHVARYFEQ
ncbi:hypothetical protein HDU96_000764 [Phlyctochytrium bullatum]|nr:hypothetical protein HDU96_000764 [Phlyctochytrium bullatum]